MLFTDGITESRNKENEEFTLDKLMDILQNHSQLSASQLIDKINIELNSFTSGVDQMDDQTLVIIKKTERSSGR